MSAERILELAAELVRIPSRGGIDPYRPILNFVEERLAGRGLACRRLADESGQELALLVEVDGAGPGPTLCLNACLDTAPFGDETAWSVPPSGGVRSGGRLYGRGAADCKIAVAMFSHLAAELRAAPPSFAGRLQVLFDADEHTGRFGGVQAFLRLAQRRPDAVVVGYPGNHEIIIGARGFLRLEISTFGTAAHSGSKSNRGVNALLRMAELIESLRSLPLPAEDDPFFRFGPKLTVTELRGGEGFSLVPDVCTCKVDVRLTPHFARDAALGAVQDRVQEFDRRSPGVRPCEVHAGESWPPYRLDPGSPLVQSFAETARGVFARPIPTVVCGPSNIGNFLAAHDVPAISGFGVTYANIHAADEYIEETTVAPAYETYRRFARAFLAAGGGAAARLR